MTRTGGSTILPPIDPPADSLAESSTTPDRLAALAIESRPDPSSATFTNKVRELADLVGADPGRLAEALA